MKITQVIMGLFLSASIQQIDANDIVGKWITVDDKTGFSRGDVLITKMNKGFIVGKLQQSALFLVVNPQEFAKTVRVL